MGSPDSVQGFLDRIDRQDACWRWPGTWQTNSYALGVRGSRLRATRRRALGARAP